MAAVYAFFVLSPEIRVQAKQIALSAGIVALIVAQFPLALLIAGRTGTGGNHLAWRRSSGGRITTSSTP